MNIEYVWICYELHKGCGICIDNEDQDFYSGF